jgi:hypothetical protein
MTDILIENVTFNDNDAGIYGILYLLDCPKVELLNTRIVNNTATFNSAITAISSYL